MWLSLHALNLFKREALIKAHLMNKNITGNLIIFHMALYKLSFKENAAFVHIIAVYSSLYASTYFIYITIMTFMTII